MGGISAFESQWQHWTVEEITLSSDSVEWGEVYLPLSVNDNIEQWRDHSVLCYCYPGGYICLWVSMTTLNSKEITLTSAKLTKGDICLWVSMTTLNSEEITLSSATVTKGGISAFECQWQHWTVKRSLCPLLNWPRGDICLWVSMTTLNSEENTLSSAGVEWGGGISAFESQW